MQVFLPYTPAEIVTDADIYTEFEDHLIMKNPNVCFSHPRLASINLFLFPSHWIGFNHSRNLQNFATCLQRSRIRGTFLLSPYHPIYSSTGSLSSEPYVPRGLLTQIDAETGRKVAQRIGFSFSGTTPNPGLSHLYLESLSNIEVLRFQSPLLSLPFLLPSFSPFLFSNSSSMFTNRNLLLMN